MGCGGGLIASRVVSWPIRPGFNSCSIRTLFRKTCLSNLFKKGCHHPGGPFTIGWGHVTSLTCEATVLSTNASHTLTDCTLILEIETSIALLVYQSSFYNTSSFLLKHAKLWVLGKLILNNIVLPLKVRYWRKSTEKRRKQTRVSHFSNLVLPLCTFLTFTIYLATASGQNEIGISQRLKDTRECCKYRPVTRGYFGGQSNKLVWWLTSPRWPRFL